MNTDYIAESPEGGNSAVEAFSQSSLVNLDLDQIRSLSQPGNSGNESSGVEEILGNFSLEEAGGDAGESEISQTTPNSPSETPPDRPRYPSEYDPIFTQETGEESAESFEVAGNTRRSNGQRGNGNERDALLDRRLLT